MPDDVARLERLIAETMAEVNYLDWGLIEIRDCIRASRKAIALSRELLLRLDDSRKSAGSANFRQESPRR